MRLWSIHPGYLDAKGLVALWREGLLARKVLAGKTSGYKNHPQLIRFKSHKTPLRAVDAYLSEVLKESRARGYSFDGAKIKPQRIGSKIPVTRGQAQYELAHLKKKLKKRDYKAYLRAGKIKKPEINVVFRLINGPVENWEKLQR